MSKGVIGWNFPPTNGGREDGFNDPGVAIFSGNPLSSVARETIQNSLDARESEGEPVHMDFEIVNLTDTFEFARTELEFAIKASLDVESNDDKARMALGKALTIIRRKAVPSLRISDRNTTGLRGTHWHALVKMQGASVKGIAGAGGSHGIGKYAPFAISPLRTVFYWTHFKENGKSIELFQGRSVLVSHRDREGNRTQGTGFFGVKNGCQELRGNQIPAKFKLRKSQKDMASGTAICIAGFQAPKNWQLRVAASVIENFFYAIHRRDLSVMIEPENETLYEISDETLEAWFDGILDGSETNENDDSEMSSIRAAKHFWDVLRRERPVGEKEDPTLGHCRLWIHVADRLPSRVAFIRRGMLITTQQRRLQRFPGMRDFVAVCVFDAPKGNELLRKMENPQHDQFEPGRLLDSDERKRGERALKNITDWIRSEIRRVATPPKPPDSTDLNELAEYLPDLEPDPDFDYGDSHNTESSNETIGFGVPAIRLKPRRRPQSADVQEDDEVEDGEGTDRGSHGGGPSDGEGGGSNGGGEDEGNSTGGTGTRGGTRGRRVIDIEDARIVPVAGTEDRFSVGFMPRETALVSLHFEEAGDSGSIRKDGITATSEGSPLDLGQIEAVKGKRIQMEVELPTGSCAWRILAERADTK